MDIKIDWLSFTVPLPSGTVGEGDETVSYMLQKLNEFTGGLLVPVIGWHGREVNKGRGFYKVVITDDDTKARLSWGDTNPHIYVEINGVACEKLRAFGAFDQILQKVGFRASRVDIAGDYETDLQPSGVIGNFYKDARMSHSHIVSGDGETVYVGSRKSERFLRVYRYRHPHPRAHLLRIEHEFKGDMAKRVCATVSAGGLIPAFEVACNSYHWDDDSFKHEQWTEGKLRAKLTDRGNAGALIWLAEQVAPALIRLHREGVIEIDDWFETNIFQKLH